MEFCRHFRDLSSAITLLWLRNDLRIGDNPALTAALASGSVIPVYVHAPEEEETWRPGAASNWWLHHSLSSLNESLAKRGSQLVIRTGETLPTLRELIAETGATQVVWNRRYEPAIIARDTGVKTALENDGITVQSHNGALLNEPWKIQNKSGKPFQVFTPYWRHCVQNDPGRPLPAPGKIPGPKSFPPGLAVADLGLLPEIPWDEGLARAWKVGEDAAKKALERFCRDAFANYGETRNLPDRIGTSRLSPHLHFGEISPRQVWAGLAKHGGKEGLAETEWRGSQFLAEIGWREFAHHLLYHFPHTTEKPLRPEFEQFAWRRDDEGLRAWQRGQTGYPLVDAGMRELWRTGWMHNRVRMVVASFLVKDLLIPWQEGARWFWDTLVDADLASNTLGWQWTAGCGADAAPFFRIFNPVNQGEKFDPLGDYVRLWVPELKRLPDKWIHQPWRAKPEILEAAGVLLGETYPEPVVNHGTARDRAMDVYRRMKGK